MLRIVVLGILLAGCADATRDVKGPGGVSWKSVACHKTPANCIEQAGFECPSGYIIGDKSGDWYADPNVVTGSTPQQLYAGRMLVLCK